MACGIPAVSFDCDNGPRNIIADGEDGLLVKKCDVEELAVTVCRMIEHKDMRLQMGAAACKNITRFQEKTIFEQYLAFLTKEVGSES
jgi:glycosyltransferase involved in cell wall biosynthesis